MERSGDLLYIFFLFSPVIIHAIQQMEIIKESLPNAGTPPGGSKLLHYWSVLNLSNRNHIRLAVRTRNDAGLLFSEKPANLINYGTDINYFEIIIGGFSDTKSIIRVGTLSGLDVMVDIVNILDETVFKYFWVSWYNGVIKVGRGLMRGGDIFIEGSYNSGINIKYLSILNGWGCNGTWEVYAGIPFIYYELILTIISYC